MRADYAMSGRADQYSSNVAAMYLTTPGTKVDNLGLPSGKYAYYLWNGFADGGKPSSSNSSYLPNGVAKASSNMMGWEARGRVDLDARTPSAYGTVQAVTSIRLARTTGTLDQTGPALSSSGAGATLEAAYVRFAGFTFGAAKDNFSFMPSIFYGAGHWSSFANGAKQLAYTAVLGGGFSATLAIQDAADTTAGGSNALYTVTNGAPNAYADNTAFGLAFTGPAAPYSYNNVPQINGRIDFDQSWGTISAVGALGKAIADSADGTTTKNKNVWALGAGVKLNVPQLAAGDALYLNGGYADGMTEYTTNWTSFKSSDTKRNVGGYVTNHQSWMQGTIDGVNTIQTFKSWNVAGIFTHYWTPQWRNSFVGTYGKIDAPTLSQAQVYGQSNAAFGNATVWNVGTQLAFLPTKDFEIGVDVLYARVAQDIRRLNYATAVPAASTTAYTGTTVTRESAGNWTGRLRVERTF